MLIAHQPRANRQRMGIAPILRANWVNAVANARSNFPRQIAFCRGMKPLHRHFIGAVAAIPTGKATLVLSYLHNGSATDYRSRRSTHSDSAGWPGCSRKSLSVCSEKDDRKVMISVLTQSLSVCETELWVPLDGGSTYTTRITPLMDPNTIYFYSTVPSTPTNSAVLDIRFGCEPSYPEGFNPQTTSAFMIAGAGSQ